MEGCSVSDWNADGRYSSALYDLCKACRDRFVLWMRNGPPSFLDQKGRLEIEVNELRARVRELEAETKRKNPRDP